MKNLCAKNASHHTAKAAYSQENIWNTSSVNHFLLTELSGDKVSGHECRVSHFPKIRKIDGPKMRNAAKYGEA
jgi:hypothetical protein